MSLSTIALQVLAFALSAPEDAPTPKPELRVGGLLQPEFIFFPGDAEDTYRDEFRLRRLRLLLRGSFGALSFRLTPDIASGNLRIMDAFVDARLWRSQKGELTVRIGKDKPPVSMDILSSSSNLLLLERGVTSQLSPTRDLGAALIGRYEVFEGHLMVSNGASDGSTTDGNSADDLELAASIDLHFAHALIGLSGSIGEARGATVATYRTPGRRLLRALPTGDEPAVGDGLRWRAGAHGHLRLGPVLVWSEALLSQHHVSRADSERSIGSAGAVSLGVSWLSGHTPNAWDAPRPADTLELAARLGVLDENPLDDTPSLGEGELAIDPPKRMLTGAFAATWHIDSHFKAVLGYEVTKADGFDLEHMVGLRLQAYILEPL